MEENRPRKTPTVQRSRKGVTRQSTVSGRRTAGGGAAAQRPQRKKLPGQNPQSVPKSSPLQIYIIAAAGVLMLCGIVAIVVVKMKQSEGDITAPALGAASGQVEVQDANGLGRVVTTGYRFAPGDRVKVGNGEAELVYDNGTAMKLTSNANLQLGGPWFAALNAGSFSGAVGKLPEGTEFVVETPHGKAHAYQGTSFILKVDKTGTRLNVMRGSVNFQDKIRQRSKVFSAGQTAFVPIETIVKEKKAAPKKTR